MWVLKIKGREKGNIYEERAIKFKVRIYFYSHNYYEEKDKIFFVGSGLVEGTQENKISFFKDLKADKRVNHLEENKDYFICIYQESKKSIRGNALRASYNPRIIFLKPAVIDTDGWEEWEIASTKKEYLIYLIDESEKLKNFEYKILQFKQKKIDNLMIYSSAPNLTDKQKNALMLAIEEGYYGYPRKTTLERLAKASKISLSTFQFHLAKAEAKLMPFFLKKVNS